MKILPLLIIFLLAHFCVYAQAAELYNKGDYGGAAAKYEELLETAPDGRENPYLYYNLANSYFKAGEPDKAVINYYRAFNILPRDKDIKRNLAFALNAAGQRLAPEGVPPAAFDIYYWFSMGELKGLLWFFAWFFALALCAYAFLPRKKWFLKILFLSGACIVLCGLWYFARLRDAGLRRAVATAPRAEVRSGPGENFPVSLSLPRAYLVIITDTKGDWAEVEAPAAQNASGWVLKTQIEEI
ncbi:MAG: tetratricopeptide repeat protein [Elusimicrobiota bacterium]|jgi:tetratricopeptide (TPR) repeat protein|nr:tetratricopeptide repeat protein [Elusimicrobiota bacterium]